jgi:hypothetical protein
MASVVQVPEVCHQFHISIIFDGEENRQGVLHQKRPNRRQHDSKKHTHDVHNKNWGLEGCAQRCLLLWSRMEVCSLDDLG